VGQQKTKSWLARDDSSLVLLALHNGFDQGVMQFSDVRVIDIESNHTKPCRKVGTFMYLGIK
jgi:hypothetical protein